MRNFITFRIRLLVGLWLILALGMLLPFWLYQRNFSNEIISDAKAAAIRQMDHLYWVLSEKTFRNTDELQTWLSQAGQQLNLRISFIDLDGRALADSKLLPAQISGFENLSGRPEFLQAISEKMGWAIRYSKVSHAQHVFVAKKISLSGPFPPGVLRIASPFSTIKNLLSSLSRWFVFLIAITFAATLVLSWALIRRLRVPVSELVKAVDAIGAGNFKYRVHTGDEVIYPLAVSINRMAETMGGRKEEMTGRCQRLEAVFDGMREGVMVLNSKGRILEVNRAFGELIAPRQTCLGRNPLEVVRSIELQEACERVLARTAPDCPVESIEVSPGRHRVFSVSIVKLCDHNQYEGAIVVFHDISNIKRLEKVRQDFVANVSRELAAPLVSIQTHIQNVLDVDFSLEEKTRNSLSATLKEAGHMLRIVDDLLQLAALESGQAISPKVSINPAAALAEAWDQCRSEAVHKQIQLDSTLPETGIGVAADFGQLVRVFRNLLENGIKYSLEGGKLRVGHRTEGDTAIVFSVRDEGTGIPRQHQQRIFERFYRAGKPISGEQTSTGLGLAICKHIVQNHGGTIWVESPNPFQQNGATFHFSMRLAQEEEAVGNK